jgi:hypothetical protein
MILGAFITLTVVACESNRALSSETAGAPAYGIQLQRAATNLPRGTVVYRFPRGAAPAVADTVTVTLAGLDSLDNGYYTVWVGDSLGTQASFRRVSGTLTVTRTDTVIDPRTGDPAPTATVATFPNTSSFQRGGARTQVALTITRASAGLAATDSIHTVLVTVEQSATAASPSARRRPLWATRASGFDSSSASAGYRRTPLNFGNFSAKSDSVYVYVPNGRGRAYFRGNVLTSEDSSLTRPPMGYYYAAFIVKRDSLNTPVDTVFLGPLSSPYPLRLSLRDADSVIVDPTVQTSSPPQILAASLRLLSDTVSRLPKTNPFAGFADFFVSLERKDRATAHLGPAILLQASVPGIVRKPRVN